MRQVQPKAKSNESTETGNDHEPAPHHAFRLSLALWLLALIGILEVGRIPVLGFDDSRTLASA